MQKGACLYEGKAKRIYKTETPGVLWVEYKDDATAFNGEKKDVLTGKGRLNNEISSLIFTQLKQEGIDSHFIERLSSNEQLIKEVEIVPIEVVVRNVAAGSLVKRLGIERATAFNPPIVEFYYKDDALGDPIITDEHVRVMNLASKEEVDQLKDMALQVNEHLKQMFKKVGIQLVDFKLEFGRDQTGAILLADEISPDTCRLWDEETGESFDKDLFRFQLGNLQDGYETILTRLGGLK
ncbi:phosphoribosylaminoimidazolesuccinocarboxamide synthase [Evansella cellulosilytica]|uniref:Phosphoribosylaminoimidazole-succinocarboxamide synthase n=1 Tax=Evansella cellulosilytica (strain ATCC 21833 / DSM 2522 / FERM P-1141 / JCM 9156 / N-4) TaxID=649639 RepID=E6TWL5_EVAC2|nr:phosphoribosylaminoimidazolesuccinocarboxamide synthase [Evansella cellulosilytica]ADU28698.1 phosphoribosylaminoimidazole-succinocarboxamide synthase [Evansella cellulosilytica DSM 2522]